MGKAATNIENFANCSPTIQLRRSFSFTEGSNLSASNNNNNNNNNNNKRSKSGHDFNAKVLLLHGVFDCTVPVTSTIEYAESLRLHDIEVHTAYPEVNMI
jgi:hypothetical protein